MTKTTVKSISQERKPFCDVETGSLFAFASCSDLPCLKTGTTSYYCFKGKKDYIVSPVQMIVNFYGTVTLENLP